MFSSVSVADQEIRRGLQHEREELPQQLRQRRQLFLTFKAEAIYSEALVSREQMRRKIFEYIEVEYDRHRPHSANGYFYPAAFEAPKVA